MPSSNNHRLGSVGEVGGGVSLSNRGRFDTGWEVDMVVLDTDVVVEEEGEEVEVEGEEEEVEDDEGRGGDGERSRLFDLEVSNMFSVSPPFSLPLLLLLLCPSLLVC
tara:strand:+ start:326 stop:646 length:321 start_codon:yes stop_codon:yes gene_type:complete